MQLNIGVIKGDGIGPEIVPEAMKVLDKVAGKSVPDIPVSIHSCCLEGGPLMYTESRLQRRLSSRQNSVTLC